MSNPHDNIWSDTAKEGDDVVEFQRRINVLEGESGTLFISDSNNNRIKKTDAVGNLITSWGSFGTGNGQFDHPSGLAVATTTKNVYVVDTGNNRIQVFSNVGVFLGSWGSFGTGNGQFDHPLDVAVDAPNDAVYVVDAINNRIQKFTLAGVFVLKWGAVNPTGIAVAGDGHVYTTNDGVPFHVNQWTATGAFINQFGSSGSGDGEFGDAKGLGIDGLGNLYISNGDNNRVEKFDSGHVFDLNFGSGGTGDGEFATMHSVAVTGLGWVVTMDESLHRIQIFNNLGVFSHKFGSLGSGDENFNRPTFAAVDGEFVGTQWFRYTPSAISLGFPDGGVSVPALGSLDEEAAGVHAQHIIDMREALEILVTKYINAVTGEPFEWNPFPDIDNSAYRLALGDRDTSPSDFGFETPTPGDTWFRTLAQMDDEGIHDLEIGEIGLILNLLEASAPV